MTLTPLPWQVADLAKLRAANYTGLIATEAGGGKTFLTCLVLAEAKPRVTLIVAPKSTHHTAWIPTLEKNFGVTARVIGNGNKATKQALFDFEMGYAGVYLVTPQWVARTDISSWTGDFLVIDEIHMGAVTPKSKLQRAVSGYSGRDAQPLNRRFARRLALSATPMRGDFSNMWGVTKFLWPERDDSGDIADYNFVNWQFARMSSKMVYTSQRNSDGTPKQVREFVTEKEPGRLISEMPCAVIHKRRETCCQFHPGGFLSAEEPQVIERRVELSAKQRKAIRDMSNSMMAWLETAPLIAEISLTQKQRIRQLSLAEADAVSHEVETSDGLVERTKLVFKEEYPSPFADETIHILSNLPKSEPVVVYLESQRYAEILVSKLNKAGFPAAEYSGVRKANLDEFGKSYHVLVGVVSAIGTGTDGLQAKCSTEIWFEQPISLTMQTQAQARLDRMGGRKVQRYLLLDDEGVQEGRVEALWAQQIVVNESLRSVA